MGFLQQSQGASASRRAGNVAIKSAQAAALDRQTGISQRQRLARESASAEITQVVNQSRQAQGTAAVAAAESGAAGNSVAALLQDFQRQELDFISQTERNLEADDLTAELEGRAVGRETQARISQIQASVQPRPNFLNALLRIGGSAIQQNTARNQRIEQAGRP